MLRVLLYGCPSKKAVGAHFQTTGSLHAAVSVVRIVI